MKKNNEWRPGCTPDERPGIEPEIIEPEVVEPEVVEPEVVEPEVIEPEVVERENARQRFSRRGGFRPFPLSAAKLEALVKRIDVVGPRQLGAFYPILLHRECALLLPRPVYGFDDVAFDILLATWSQNAGFFNCAAIGNVLAYYANAKERMNHADR